MGGAKSPELMKNNEFLEAREKEVENDEFQTPTIQRMMASSQSCIHAAIEVFSEPMKGQFWGKP